MVAREDIRHGIRALALTGLPVCVHSSLRSFGWVDGGAAAVVQAFVDEGCTLLVSTFSWQEYAVPPPPIPALRPARNGADYEREWPDTPAIHRIYSPATNDLDADSMGAIPAAVLSMPGRIRGYHPLNSFTAIGPLAEQLIAPQGPTDVFAPLQRLADTGGWVVLMGVGLTSMTLLHLAERLAGRELFRRWANDPDGQPMMVAVGSCSSAFDRFDRLLASVEGRTRVGESLWRAFPARETLQIATEAIRSNPRITHCGRPGCRCDDAVAGGPILSG